MFSKWKFLHYNETNDTVFATRAPVLRQMLHYFIVVRKINDKCMDATKLKIFPRSNGLTNVSTLTPPLLLVIIVGIAIGKQMLIIVL